MRLPSFPRLINESARLGHQSSTARSTSKNALTCRSGTKMSDDGKKTRLYAVGDPPTRLEGHSLSPASFGRLSSEIDSLHVKNDFLIFSEDTHFSTSFAYRTPCCSVHSITDDFRCSNNLLDSDNKNNNTNTNIAP
jgi:hypothetical protein